MSTTWYRTGETIPGHGRVVRTSDTAYLVESGAWVPFYGPKGVHTSREMATPLALDVTAGQLAAVKAMRPVFEAQNAANIAAMIGGAR